MLYSKNGSIPYPYTDGTDGWIEVPDKPEAPEGKEVVWWYPPGWVIRDPVPPEEENVKWSWSQSTEQWMRYELSPPVTDEIVFLDTAGTSGDVGFTTGTNTAGVSMMIASSNDTLSFGISTLSEDENGN
jgi:hypothetical protein